MARPSNTADRQREIVDGLLEVIATEGYERASIARIAQAAELAPGLVHYHFESKQEVLLALLDRLATLVRDRFERRYGEDPLVVLDAFIDAHLALDDDAEPRAVAAWVVIGAEALRQPRVRERYQAVVAQRLAQLDAIVETCLRAAHGHARGKRAVAAGILAAIEGAYQLSAAAPGAMPRGGAATTVRRMAHALVGGAV